jgi:preprotein translocase subunit SecG
MESNELLERDTLGTKAETLAKITIKAAIVFCILSLLIFVLIYGIPIEYLYNLDYIT